MGKSFEPQKVQSPHSRIATCFQCFVRFACPICVFVRPPHLQAAAARKEACWDFFLPRIDTSRAGLKTCIPLTHDSFFRFYNEPDESCCDLQIKLLMHFLPLKKTYVYTYLRKSTADYISPKRRNIFCGKLSICRDPNS